MKALILDGSTEEIHAGNVQQYLAEYLRINNYEVTVRTLRNEKIQPCLGCFGCWIKTPGRCVINDDADNLPQTVMQSDLLILFSPVTFGMYSSELKKALDRFVCPVLLPFLKKINGEIHHPGRYEKYPRIVAIGTLDNPDEESENTFNQLVARNAINLHSTATSTIVYSNDKKEKVKTKIDSVLANGGAN